MRILRSRQTGVKGTAVPLRGAGCPRSTSLFAPPQAAKGTLQRPWRSKGHILFLLPTNDMLLLNMNNTSLGVYIWEANR